MIAITWALESIGTVSNSNVLKVMADQGFGDRMRFLRKQRSMSLDQLAEATGLNKSFLSRVERKLAIPSITTVIKVSTAFNIRVGQLFGDSTDDSAICIVRKGQGERFMGNDTVKGGNYESIAAQRTYKTMEPFIMRPPKEFQSEARFSFTGEHFVYCLSGLFEIEFPDRTIHLEPGDSVYFDSHIPHRTRSAGRKQAEVLVVVVPIY